MVSPCVRILTSERRCTQTSKHAPRLGEGLTGVNTAMPQALAHIMVCRHANTSRGMVQGTTSVAA